MWALTWRGRVHCTVRMGHTWQALTGRAALFTDSLFVRMHPLPTYPNVTELTSGGHVTAGGGFACPGHALKEHMYWWCAPFLMWQPVSRLWGRCESTAGVTPQMERARLDAGRSHGRARARTGGEV